MRCLTQRVSLFGRPRRPLPAKKRSTSLYKTSTAVGGSASLCGTWYRSRPHKSGTLDLEAAWQYVAQARGVYRSKLPMAGARSETKPRRCVAVTRTRVAVIWIEFSSKPAGSPNDTIIKHHPATWFLIHEVQASSSKRGNVGGGELYALTAAGSSCCWSHSKNSMPASALISSPASRPIFSASAGAPTLLER